MSEMKANNIEAYPYPIGLVGLSDESEYRDTLSSIFQQFGWVVKKEVTSMCKTSRADLIVSNEKWGTFGIECKYGEKTRPRMWAKALKQAQRYNELDFGEGGIDGWVVTVESELSATDNPFDQREKRQRRGYREFMNVMGIGVLRTDTKLELVFNNSNPMVKIPIAQIEYPTGELLAPSPKRLEDCDTKEAKEYLKE